MKSRANSRDNASRPGAARPATESLSRASRKTTFGWPPIVARSSGGSWPMTRTTLVAPTCIIYYRRTFRPRQMVDVSLAVTKNLLVNEMSIFPGIVQHGRYHFHGTTYDFNCYWRGFDRKILFPVRKQLKFGRRVQSLVLLVALLYYLL